MKRIFALYLIVVSLAYSSFVYAETSEKLPKDIVKLQFNKLPYDQNTKNKYPDIAKKLDSKKYREFDHSGDKIQLFEAKYAPKKINKPITFVFNSSNGSAFCGSAGCSFTAYLSQKKLIDVHVGPDVYLQNCKNTTALIFSRSRPSVWEYNQGIFVHIKSYKDFTQIPACSSN